MCRRLLSSGLGRRCSGLAFDVLGHRCRCGRFGRRETGGIVLVSRGHLLLISKTAPVTVKRGNYRNQEQESHPQS